MYIEGELQMTLHSKHDPSVSPPEEEEAVEYIDTKMPIYRYRYIDVYRCIHINRYRYTDT